MSLKKQMEVAAAFAAGTIVGTLIAKKRSASAPPQNIPDPPPLPRTYKKKILLRNLDIDGKCGPDGEEKRVRAHSDTPTSPRTSRIQQRDIISISSKLKKTPPLLTVEQKSKTFFHESPVLKELITKTPKVV